MYKAYSYKQTSTVDVFTLLPLDTIKSWLKLSSGNTVVDDELKMLADLAVSTAEDYTSRTFGKKTFITYRDGFFEHRHGLQWDLRLRKSPFVSITSIEYFDTDNILKVLDPSLYRVVENNNYCKIVFPDYDALPDVYEFENSVVITFQSGYEALPSDIKSALLSHVASAWINRGDCQDDKYNNIPANSIAVYRGYKIVEVGV